MAGFAPVPVPVCEPDFRTDGVDEQIRAWASSEPMRALVTAYGSAMPEVRTGELLSWLEDFSTRHWDFRGGRERHLARAEELTPEVTELVTAAATALQLVTPAPPAHRAYDHALVLGGLQRACLQRTEYAARLINKGDVSFPRLAALGSFRPLTDADRQVPGPDDGRYEVDAMDAGVRAGFDFAGPADHESSPGEVTTSSWSVTTYRSPGVVEAQVLAAPSGEPATRRANTADTYEFWARRARLRATDRILVITSPIYVPFQHADAIRMLALRYRCGIETIGFDPEQATLAMAPGASGPDRYLQEIRSGIRSMRQLHTGLGGVTA
jgi:hypothetical protein